MEFGEHLARGMLVGMRQRRKPKETRRRPAPASRVHDGRRAAIRQDLRWVSYAPSGCRAVRRCRSAGERCVLRIVATSSVVIGLPANAGSASRSTTRCRPQLGLAVARSIAIHRVHRVYLFAAASTAPKRLGFETIPRSSAAIRQNVPVFVDVWVDIGRNVDPPALRSPTRR